MKPANYSALERYQYKAGASHMLQIFRTCDDLAQKANETAGRLRQLAEPGDIEAYTLYLRLLQAVGEWERERDKRYKQLGFDSGKWIYCLNPPTEYIWFAKCSKRLNKPLTQAGKLLERIENTKSKGTK